VSRTLLAAVALAVGVLVHAQARASRVAEDARGRRANLAAWLVGVGVLLFAVAPSTAIAARTRLTASAADTSSLSDFAPTFHCRGAGSPSLSGTGLDGSDLKLTVRHTGHGAGQIEHVALKGTLHFTLDAQLTGSVQCEASALAPVPDLPGVRVGPDFSLNTTGSVDGDFTWEPSINVSFDVSRDGFTHRVMQFANHSGVIFSGDGTARLDLLLEATAGTRAGGPLEAGLIAKVGPEITATASANSADHSLCWSVTGQAAASLNAYFRVWHWLKANKTWAWQSRPFGFAPQCTTTAAPSPQPIAPPAPSASLSVPLATLCENHEVQSHAVNGCPYPGTSEVRFDGFERTILIEDNDESVLPTYWNLFDFPATSCSSIALTFAMPTEDSQPGDQASIQITAPPLAPQSATIGYGQIGKLEATLDGHPWSLENAATNTDDKIAINGVASCSTPSGY
jgi:hypothetical protein